MFIAYQSFLVTRYFGMKRWSDLRLLLGTREMAALALSYLIYFYLLSTLTTNLSGQSILDGLSYPATIHFFLIPVYLYLISRHDTYFNSAYSLIRYGCVNRAFVSRIRLSLLETFIFLFPYWILLIISSLLQSQTFDLWRTLLLMINFSLGILQIGIISCLLCLRFYPSYPATFSLYLVLSVDYFAAAGVFSFDSFVFYYPLLSVFNEADSMRILINIVYLLMRNIVLYFAGFYLVDWKPNMRITGYPSKLNRPIYLNSLWGIATGFFLTIFGLAYRPESVEIILLGLYGGISSLEQTSLIDLAILSSPILLQLFLYAAIVNDDLPRAAVYQFTRSMSRERWLSQKLSSVFISACLFYGAMVMTSLITALLVGVPVISSGYIITLLISLMLGAGLCNAAFVLLSNIFGFWMKPSFAFLLTWLLYTPGQIIFTWFNKYLSGLPVILNPSSQAVLTLHHLSGLRISFPEFFEYAINGFSTSFSLAYNLSFILIIVYIGLAKIKKLDLTVG